MKLSDEVLSNLKFVFKLTMIAISIQAYNVHQKDLALWVLLAGIFLEG